MSLIDNNDDVHGLNNTAKPSIKATVKLASDLCGTPGKSKKVKMNVLLTTYELILRDAAMLGDIKWHALAVDEAHRLKNSEGQLYELRTFPAASKSHSSRKCGYID
ncbi:hypothetical protein DFH11DRAFT_1729510 [Phellopilus nigrolimitatus]|nr:hypothetical protein DFH11DRAFT_1729510 [Phellopilus nigrolimitatus]